MKSTTVLTLLAVICFLQLVSAGLLSPGLPGLCCKDYKQNIIPKKKVTFVEMTSSSCDTKALVVTTVSGKAFCIDPEWTWAKKLMEEFSRKTSTTSSATTSSASKKKKLHKLH